MSSPLERAMMEFVKNGAKMLACVVGQLFPVCEAIGPVLDLALQTVHSKEVFYVKEQLLTVLNRLDVLSSQQEDIYREIRKGRLDLQYFSVEENVRNQFRKYMDILEAKPEFHEVNTIEFRRHFARTGGEKNLHVLYDAMMGINTYSESVLDVVERCVLGNRHLLEDFCVRIKELFFLGLIALLGHCTLTQKDKKEYKMQDWSNRIEEVESRMKTTIEACVAAFPKQAKLDAQRLLQEKDQQNPRDFAEALKQFLVGKYDWVSWSVRVINHLGSTYRNWRAGDHFHHVAGQNWFEVLQVNNVNLVVSYSSGGAPQKVPRDFIQQLMEGPGKNGNAQAVVEVLEKQLSGFVVHAISRHKDSVIAWSFPVESHYWERHKNVVLCVHSE